MNLKFKRIIAFIIVISSVTSCNSQKKPSPSSDNGKGVPNTINREAKFIKVSLSVKVISKENLEVESAFTNTSDSIFYLYKDLLPENEGEHFGILSKSSPEQIPYTGNNKWADLVDSSTGLVRVESDKVIPIRPNETLHFKLNIANLYNFKEHEAGSYTIIYSAAMPFIKEGKHTWEKDVDDSKKPIYYYIFSDRVEFSLKK